MFLYSANATLYKFYLDSFASSHSTSSTFLPLLSATVSGDSIDSSGAKVLAATSTLDKSIKSKGRSVQSAKEVGEKIADLSIKNGIKKVIFDRSGYRYHGRIKMIAEAAREKGLEI